LAFYACKVKGEIFIEIYKLLLAACQESFIPFINEEILYNYFKSLT
jgi:hypothetical protein